MYEVMYIINMCIYFNMCKFVYVFVVYGYVCIVGGFGQMFGGSETLGC